MIQAISRLSLLSKTKSRSCKIFNIPSFYTFTTIELATDNLCYAQGHYQLVLGKIDKLC